jgi:hypothetical protein
MRLVRRSNVTNLDGCKLLTGGSVMLYYLLLGRPAVRPKEGPPAEFDLSALQYGIKNI